ncbi:MAG TPA: hypothetical protein VIL85_28500 [Thermomicrobiales bacterium]|jgi:hypothetical protein
MMEEQFRAPGPPHIIRWRTPDEATIEADGAVLAVLSVGIGTPYDLEVLREPATAGQKDALARAITWAMEEHQRRETGEG